MRSLLARAAIVSLLVTALIGVEAASGATVSIRDAIAREGGTAVVSVRLAKAQRVPVSVRWRTRNASALAGADYQRRSGVVRFGPRQRRKSIRIPTVQDTAVESVESFTVALSALSKRRPPRFADRLALVQITDDDFATVPPPFVPPAAVVETTTSATTGGTTSGTGGGGDTTPPAPPPPTISIADVSEEEGDVGTKTFSFVVTLSGASTQTVQATFSTADGSAVAPTDYQPATNVPLTFVPGDTSETATVTVNGDTDYEGDQTFTVTLGGLVNATMGDGSAVGTIEEDDELDEDGDGFISSATGGPDCNDADEDINPDAPELEDDVDNDCDGTVDDGAPTLSVNDVGVTEGTGAGTTPATFTVTRGGETRAPVSVQFSTAGNTATSANDFSPTSGTLNFAAGETTKTVTVNVTRDSLDDADTETFHLNLHSPVGATVTDSQGVGTITDDDPLPAISISNNGTVEGNSGTTPVAFNVTLNTPSNRTVTVQWAVNDNGATAGQDYVDNGGTVTFVPGDISETVNVSVIGDTVDEPNEFFFVDLFSPTNATFADQSANGTITDDDTAAISIDNVGMTEGNAGTKTFAFNVTLSTPSDRTVTVNYATANNTATTDDGDYNSASGTLTFTPGDTSETVSVTVNGDTDFEATETFFVNLSAPTGGAVISDGQGQGTIANDDDDPATIPP